MEPFLALFTHDARIVDPVYGAYEGPDRAGPRRFLELMHENHTSRAASTGSGSCSSRGTPSAAPRDRS
jgi:hypothetical protein